MSASPRIAAYLRSKGDDLPDGEVQGRAARPRVPGALRRDAPQDAAQARTRRLLRDGARRTARSVASGHLEASQGARARRADPAPARGAAPHHPAADRAAAQRVGLARAADPGIARATA